MLVADSENVRGAHLAGLEAGVFGDRGGKFRLPAYSSPPKTRDYTWPSPLVEYGYALCLHYVQCWWRLGSRLLRGVVFFAYRNVSASLTCYGYVIGELLVFPILIA